MPSGVVKFFNGAKGFGFIAPEDGGADIFVHVSAVERSGLGGLNEGDQVNYEIEADRRSGKPAAIDLEVTGSSPVARAPRAGPPRSFDRRGPEPAGRGATREAIGAGSGVVKWFNATKGFGFIQPSGGGADVFVHISAVERAGLSSLSEGQNVAYDLEQDRRSGKSSATNLRVE
jgi:CspA family cold shock protein